MANRLRSHHNIFKLLNSLFCPKASRPLTASFSRCAAELELKRALPLLCASPHSLPGNRFQNFRNVLPLLSNRRSESTRAQDASISWNLGTVGIEELSDFTPLDDRNLQEEVTQQINSCVEKGDHGRLYAVVHVRSIQYKVTPGDIIIVKHDFPPRVGDKIRLEKVLAVGGADFTLFGQPLLSRSQAFVEATVVEKTLSHNRVWSVYRKRQNFQRFLVYRERQTMLIINSVKVMNVKDESTQHIEDKHKDLLT